MNLSSLYTRLSPLPRESGYARQDKTDMSVTANISDWIVTPAPINDKKSGVRAIFSTDNSIVQRRDFENDAFDCVSYTRGPLPPGQVWQVTVLETTSGWDYGLVSGCVLSLLYHRIIWCVQDQ